MRRSYAVLILCLLAVVGAWLLWPQGRQTIAPGAAGVAATVRGGSVAATTNFAASAASPAKITALNTNKLAFRLANTTASIRKLETTPHAILLANAFIDTERPLDLKIPAHLKSAGDPGAYIVQARGPTDARFRAALADAGAQIVSYIPNNAYLVRMAATGLSALSANSLVQAVLPYEPYYKVQSSLLNLAVAQQPLPPGVALNLGVFAADAATAETEIEKLGAKIIGRDRSAFGPVLRVLAPADWTALAQSPVVQFVEPARSRVLANDLSRVTVGVSPDTTSSVMNDWLGLDGSNVLVSVNDSGVDQNQVELTPRVLGVNPIDLLDTNGHGTHVAGIIASSGAHSLTPVNVGVFAEGSVSNADFRGKAPLANLFSLNFGNADYVLQTNAARVGALISNNSWDYGDAEYDLAAASYDAATRDALPFTSGSQPVLFVFAAGNSGGGDNGGAEGSADTILSPATAKNVITVGALEQFRDITNIVTMIVNGVTNQSAYWEPQTDSGSQVAFYSARGNVGVGTEGSFGRFKPDVVSPGTFVVSTRSGQWDTNAYYNATNVSETDYADQIVISNGLVYYNVAVPPNAVAVNITIYPNNFSPNPFPGNLLIYARQQSFPTANNYDILTSNDSLDIPPTSGGAISGITAIQGNGFAFAVGNTNTFQVNYNLSVQIFTTNYLGDLEIVLEGMNEQLAPYYRYESGTSMAAADVSGVLALIQDYFTNHFQPALTPSPALMKALLINGSRSLPAYGLAVTNGINFQGWGLDNIQDCVPAGGLVNQLNAPGSSFFVDQNPNTALATGDSHTFLVNINTDAYANYLPLQATLVWTDPPGDPAAAIKLVNNLDLVITNLDTGDVYFGNDIAPDLGYNLAWDTNSSPNLDTVNNVENILLPPILAGSYSVTVVARDVNVNAVTAQVNNNVTGAYAPNVVQDFALVVSVGEGEVTNAFTVTDNGIASNPTGDQNITVVTTTNMPLYNQIVGASSPLLGTNALPLGANTIWGPNGVVTIGMTNQWHFYIVTNNGPASDYTNAAFITFDVSTLSIPRMGVLDPLGMPDATRPEADIDLFVTQDPTITNLNPAAIANCLAGANNGRSSLTQGGTEFVFYTNSAPGQVYYVGVQSEDQMAAEYAFLPVFTDVPFSEQDQNGNQIVNGLLLPANIPDGNNAHPGVATIFALAVTPMVVEKVTVTNLNEHQNFGDLFGALNHGGQHVVLNNHDSFGNTFGHAPIVYDDSRDRPLGTTNSDGPGTLVNFRTKAALGPWILGEQDNSLTMTGRVSRLTLLIQPHIDFVGAGAIVAVPPGGWFIDYVDVSAGYTNLTFYATNVTTPLAVAPIQMYEKYGDEPTLTDWDQSDWLTNGTPPGNSISVGPPLAQGQYFIGLYNPNDIEQNVFLRATLGINASVNNIFDYSAGSGQVLFDDAVNGGSVITVPNTTTQLVASVSVGLVITSPRISDYTFTLVSPTGQRILLMENRGGGDTNGAGLEFVYTNVLNSTATGGAGANTNYLTVSPLGGTVPITYNFYTVPDRMTVYDTTNAALFNTNSIYLLLDTGFTNNPAGGQGAQNTIPVTVNVPYPPGVTAITIIMNQDGNPYAAGGDAWVYTAGAPVTNYEYLEFTDNTNLATVPIKFAQPPFNFSEFSTNFLFSDLNLSASGDYLAPTNIYDAYGGWTVPTNLVSYAIVLTNISGSNLLVVVTNVTLLTNNFVSVLSDPSSSLTGDSGGSNLLALARGTITRSIPTVPGQIYNVTFWYRGPGIEGWWRGEGNATDSSDPENLNNNGSLIGRFDFPAGEVGQAFQFADPGNTYQFAGTNTYVQVPASSSLNVGAGGGFTIEGWINPTNLSRPQPLVEWLAHVPTNTAITNVIIVQGPVLNPATGHYYYLLGATNWTTSELWATQLGGHLATVETANEENWIYDTFTIYGTTNRDLWIGLTNSGPNTPFAWSGGSTNVAYTNWMPGQPVSQCASDNYVTILGPTNTYAGLWRTVGNTRLACKVQPTLPIYGVVEVPNLPTNGVQFWISGTNWTPGVTNALQGCLYANIVDTNYVSHQIYSAPGLLTSNVYQHVALTFNTNSGVAALYLNGTNVATSNLYTAGVSFVPKTDGDMLLGWDMSLYTNNFYGGQMDEMSLYSRALSLAEISAIYHASADTTNRLIGKFDPTITPAAGLAEALVSFGSSSNIIYGVDNQWSVNSFTFTATSNSMPLTISGMEPGILLDSFAINDAPETNLYYLPEQSLSSLAGDVAAGNWTLQVWDNRVGAFVANVNQLVNWQLSLVLVSNAIVSASLPPETPVTTTVPSGQIVYYSVTIPQWAHFATNVLVSSSLPVDLLFNQTQPPTGSDPNDYTLLTGATSGSGVPILVTNGIPPAQLPLTNNSTYYLGVRNNGARSATVVLEVDYDILSLTNGAPFSDLLNTNEYNTVRYFEFDVSSNAYEATFQLLQLSGNADLVVSKGVPLPTLTLNADYGSFNVNSSDENIYVLTNSEPVPLSAGRWYLGVFKRDSGNIKYSVLAKELDLTNGAPTVISLTNGVPFNWTAGPGAALTNFFWFHATNSIVGGTNYYIQGLRFELYNESGNADLTLQSNALPFAPPFFQTSQSSGRNPELIFVFTNSALTNLAGDWYLGVPNRETNLISFTIIAETLTNLYFPAFPDAQGAGSGAIGAGHAGTSNTVYHVTTVNDSGAGSLRAAVSSTNRTVVFDVGGTITLASPLIITNPYVTIAGQTAPGGITVAGDMTAVLSAHDVIIRDVRFRPGLGAGGGSTSGAWANGFEGATASVTLFAGSYFAGGWHVDFGSVDWLTTTFAPPYQGSWYIDLDDSSAGGISTNITTVPGTSYTLAFAYAKNPNAATPPQAQVLINGNSQMTLVANVANSLANLQWQTTSCVFTASSPLTTLAFHSLDSASSLNGVLLDAVSLNPNTTIVDTGDSLQFLNASNVIADHISASWSANNLMSVLNSSNVTVQWSIMADSLYQTNNPVGIGSLLRDGAGTLSFHHNLYADNYSGSPRLGDNLTLDFVNNVIYNWGVRSGLTGGTNDFDYSTSGCTNQLNYVCNYLIAGPDTARFATNNYNITNIAFFGGGTNALAANWFFQTNNFIDGDTNHTLNGYNTGWGMFTNNYTRFGRAFPAPPVPVDEAFIAYERVLDFAGVNLAQRDAVDTNIVTKVRYQTGTLTNSPPTSSLVAWWKAQNNYLDSAGANNGTSENGAGFAPGEVGNAFSFNGVNQFVLVNATAALNVGVSTGFTIEGWINPTNFSKVLPIAQYQQSLSGINPLGVQFQINNPTGSKNIYANVNDTTGTAHILTSATLLTNVWQHVALTYDNASGAATIYLNGTNVAQSVIGSITPQTSYPYFLIGASTFNGTTNSPTADFAGGIDELSVYSRALSSNEVAAIYSAGSAGKTVAAPVSSPTFLDTDQDGIPDFWEDTFTTNLVFIPSNNNDRDGDGYTDLEEYNNWLAVPHALTTVTNPVGVNLYQLCGNSGRLAFAVTNGAQGFVYLTNVLGSVTNTGTYSNSFAIFTPTNSTAGGTNYYGYASFGFYVTNMDTVAYFGPVNVSVVVSAVSIATNPPVSIIDVTNGVPYTNNCNTGGSDFYHIVVTTNDYAVLFELDNRSGPMALVVRDGLPLPSLSSYDYYTNAPAPPATEEIAVLTNSMPVPLAPGDWYMAAVNVSGSPSCLSYSAKISKLSNILPPQFLYPTNVTVTNILETVPTAISCVATDLDTPPLPLTFALLKGPAGLSISNGVIYWTPTEAQGPSTNSVIVSVSNGAFSVTNSFFVNVLESNLPPAFLLTNIPNQLVIVPGTLVLTNAATDPDIPVNALTYTLLNPPANAVINTNGVITWTPTPAQAGTNYLFATVVTDANPWAVNAQSLSVTNYFYVSVLPPLPPGLPQTNVVGSNSITWFAIFVPTNAIYATNTLIFATLPVNLWFSTNVPPTITNAADTKLLNNSTNGISVLSTNLATAPTNIVPGRIYFLGVQNTNNVPVTNAVRVDFALAVSGPVLPNIPIQIITAGDTLVVTNTATDTSTNAALIYYLTNSPAGVTISTNGIITWVTTTNLAPTNVVITTIVTDTNANLSATNSFIVIVLPGLVDDQPLTNVVGPSSINWFTIKVPKNADLATNFLLFATAPLNLWFSTNVPPSVTNSADYELLTNSTAGQRVINTVSAPLLVPGSRYFLGVQNTNNFAVTNAVKVKFHLVAPNFSIFSIIQTNIGGSNGFLITWFAPTNDQFHLQWTAALVPAHWTNFNGVISDASTPVPTNGVFQYFDDGSQTGGFGPTRFYRLLLLNSPTNTAPFFLSTPLQLNASPLVQFVFTNAAKDWDIPPQTLTYSVTNSLADTNLVINPATGVITWTPTAAQAGLTNFLTVFVTDNGVPAKGASDSFAVLVAAAPLFGSITASTNGVIFKWTAPSSEQFQIRWTTNLTPIVWHLFPNIITSATSNFSFMDTNTPLLMMKFYQLILLP
jgi:subtilisin-like proprotein convertase family protein